MEKTPNNSGGQGIVKICAAAIIAIIAAVFIFFLWLWLVPSKTIVEADAGFKKAKQAINPEELRKWALETIKRSSNGYHQIPKNEVPEYIQSLYSSPPDAWVNGSTVCCLWGGGFFHWGFYIGNTNETMPFVSDNQSYPYNFEWKPGIYYTREAKWKLQ